MDKTYLPGIRDNKGRFVKGQISPNRFGVIKKCEICNRDFYLQNYRAKDNKRGRFCGRKCKYVWATTQRFSKKTEIKKGQYANEKSPNWKGDDVGYDALHRWLRRNYKLSSKCDFCRRDNLKIVWANLTGTYNRERKNWANLCYYCHIKFDLAFPKKPLILKK